MLEEMEAHLSVYPQDLQSTERPKPTAGFIQVVKHLVNGMPLCKAILIGNSPMPSPLTNGRGYFQGARQGGIILEIERGQQDVEQTVWIEFHADSIDR
jgi:hypothetical protein